VALIIRKLNCGFWPIGQEPVLVEAYQAMRIFTLTARLLFEKETVTPDERRLAKTINFA